MEYKTLTSEEIFGLGLQDNIELLRRTLEGKDTTNELDNLKKEKAKKSSSSKGGKKGVDLKDNLEANEKEETDKEEKEEESEKEKDLNTDMDFKIKPKEWHELLSAVYHNYTPILVGPAGCGKTEMAKQLAKELGLKYYSDSSISDEYKVSGFEDANGLYKPTQFYEAFTKGGVYCLDEVDGSDPNALIKINTAIANRFMAFPQVGMKTAHKDFHIVATANTFCNGASIVYVGRNQLDGATRNRFYFIEVDYDKEIDKVCCKDADLRYFLEDYRQACERAGVLSICSYRAMKGIYEGLFAGDKKYRLDFDKLLFGFCTNGLDKSDLNKIYGNMQVSDSVYYKEFRKLCE